MRRHAGAVHPLASVAGLQTVRRGAMQTRDGAISGGRALEAWIMDLRYSARRLASRPTYTLLAVLTLTLGAGGTAAIFSIVRELLLKPLPVAHEEQIGVLWFGGSWTEQEFLYFRPNFPGFQRMAAYMPGD